MSTSSSRRSGIRSRYSTHEGASERTAGFSVAKFRSDEGTMSAQWREKRAKSEAALASARTKVPLPSVSAGSAATGVRISEIGSGSKRDTGYKPAPSMSVRSSVGASNGSFPYRRPDISVMSVSSASSVATSLEHLEQIPSRRRVKHGEGRGIARKQLELASQEIAARDQSGSRSRSTSQREQSQSRRTSSQEQAFTETPRNERSRNRGGAVVESLGSALTGNAGVLSRLSPKKLAFILVAVVLACLALMIYPAAREYYISVRSLDAAYAELAQVESRNSEVQSMIDDLSTDTGIEDYVRAKYGWVMSGETAGSVVGLEEEESSETVLPAQVAQDSVTAEDTIVNEILDIIFFVDDDDA